MIRSSLLRCVLIVVALLALAGLAAAPLPIAAQQDAAPPLSATEVVDVVAPAVVTVINEQTAGLEDEGLVPAGSGTGFIIDEQGTVVTNQHVIEGGQAFLVVFADGEEREAELVGADPVSDLAVLDIEGEVPAMVSLGDSAALEVGQAVLAIGSPLGAFTNTVTDGIVSALNRDFPGAPFYTNLIQHTAPINPGNSGGPLFNYAGEVIGVNTLGIPEAQGIFFAIPSNTVARIVEQLIEEGEVAYPYFGVAGVAQVTPHLAAQYDLTVENGVLVQDVPAGGPAAEAGIQAGDVILAIDGQAIDQRTTFTEALFAHEPGETVPVTIQRGDEQPTVEVTLGERPPDL